jgi:hypothetical protein
MKLYILTCLPALLFISLTAYSNPGEPVRQEQSSFHNYRNPIDSAKKKDTTDDDDDKTRKFEFGADYATDQSFHGIHPAEKLPYIAPEFTYTAPSGFYAEITDQYLLTPTNGGFDAFEFNPGWNIDFGDNTTLNFNWSKYFIGSNSPAGLKSDLSNQLETYIEQWIGETEGKLTVDYEIYKNKNNAVISTPNDIIITPDISHTFEIKFKNDSKLEFIPEGSIDFGTRNSFTHYQAALQDDSIKNNIRGNKRKKVQVANQAKNSSFGDIDYSLVFTVDYQLKRWEFEPAINYSALLYTVPGLTIAPLTFFTFTVTYTIPTK